jgi:hypothetical protein
MGDALLRKPIRGFAGCCCVGAASGHITAVMPTNVRNSRRLMASPAPRTPSSIKEYHTLDQELCRSWRNHNFKCFLFEVPRTVPTIGLPLHLRRRVPHDAIERSQNGAGECQYRGDEDQAFVHVTTLNCQERSRQLSIPLFESPVRKWSISRSVALVGMEQLPLLRGP